MKLSFKSLTLSDLPIIRPYIHAMKGRLCDYSLGGLFMWRDYYAAEYVISENTLFLRYHLPQYPGQHFYLMPVCDDPSIAIRRIFLHAADSGEGSLLHFAIIPEEMVHDFEEHFRVIDKMAKPEWSDYLYNASDLVELKGSKYSAKRNHLHQFEKSNHDYQQVPVESLSLKGIQDFLDCFYRWKGWENPTRLEIQEREKTYEVFEHFSEYGFTGSALLVNGKIAAISAGEVIGDTLMVHIEKGDENINGVYPKIMNSFAHAACTSQVQYVNREEDDGIPGLRRSKESYHPCNLLKKYVLRVEMK